MTNTDIILEFMEETGTLKMCDDCLSIEAEVFPRQQVNQICNRLAVSGILKRTLNVCEYCHKQKLTNTLIHYPLPSHVRKTLADEIDGDLEVDFPEYPFDIEKIRTKVVKICLELWKKYKSEPFPRSLSKSICILRDEGIIPRHESNPNNGGSSPSDASDGVKTQLAIWFGEIQNFDENRTGRLS
jgi:hypothetical protein